MKSFRIYRILACFMLLAVAPVQHSLADEPRVERPVEVCRKSCTDDTLRCGQLCATDTACIAQCKERNARCAERCGQPKGR